MRCRELFPARYASVPRTYLFQSEDESFGKRCYKTILKHVLPTLLILAVGGMLTLYLSGLIDQARQRQEEMKQAQATQAIASQGVELALVQQLLQLRELLQMRE